MLGIDMGMKTWNATVRKDLITGKEVINIYLKIINEYFNLLFSFFLLSCKLENDDKVATSDSDKAKLFSQFFSSVYKEHDADDDLIS